MPHPNALPTTGGMAVSGSLSSRVADFGRQRSEDADAPWTLTAVPCHRGDPLPAVVQDGLGPEPPEGLESNWIPSGGKRIAPCIRFHGADRGIVDQTRVMPDVEPA